MLYLLKSYDSICHVYLDNILETEDHLLQYINQLVCRSKFLFFLIEKYFLLLAALGFCLVQCQDNIQPFEEFNQQNSILSSNPFVQRVRALSFAETIKK